MKELLAICLAGVAFFPGVTELILILISGEIPENDGNLKALTLFGLIGFSFTLPIFFALSILRPSYLSTEEVRSAMLIVKDAAREAGIIP